MSIRARAPPTEESRREQQQADKEERERKRAEREKRFGKPEPKPVRVKKESEYNRYYVQPEAPAPEKKVIGPVPLSVKDLHSEAAFPSLPSATKQVATEELKKVRGGKFF